MARKTGSATKAVPPRNPYMDGSGPTVPDYTADMTFRTMGSMGLRQYGGWVREEFLPQLVGREGARVYREMYDNSPTVGAIIFAIMQSMRQVSWRVDAPSDTPEAQHLAEFVESCMDDMSQTWADFIGETLSMLIYGYAPHEIIYKRRLGRNPGKRGDKELPSSKYQDGYIGLRRMPIRGQDTIIKWFFDPDGEMAGLTQQPWLGSLIDIPVRKMLLFRPQAHKANPEGRSVLRTAYRPWYFLKRIEEQEAVMFERFSGLPVVTVPNSLLEAARSGDAGAKAALAQWQRIAVNVRIDEQMGLVIPSDTYRDANGAPTSVPMYDFKLVSPETGRASVGANTSIERYKLDIMTSVLADFLTLGHGTSSRGSQTLGEAKIDIFFQAIESWLQGNADVLNDYLLPRLWDVNGFDFDLMPKFVPDMPQRIDLDGLSNFVLRLSQAGMPLFPDQGIEEYLRDVSGLPELSEDMLGEMMPGEGTPQDAEPSEELQKHLAGMLVRRMARKGMISTPSAKKRKRFKRSPA